MTRSLASALCAAFVLASCTSAPAATPKTLTLEEHLSNPLFAKQYWTELTERMVTLHLAEDPSMKDASKAKLADEARLMAVEKEKESTKIVNANPYGHWLSIAEQTDGFVLMANGMLYFSPSFATYPGVNLRIYLSQVIDPRDAAFPDPTAIDLGTLQSPYGSQIYTIDRSSEDVKKFRTVALWDADLERLHGFAQLQITIPTLITPETTSAAGTATESGSSLSTD